MKKSMRRMLKHFTAAIAVVGLLITFVSTPAMAAYPERPITLIVPWGAGGGKPDGYTIGVATVEIGMMHWAGLTELTGQDYTPIALYNYDAAGFQVRADSEWNTVEDAINAIKANPGKHKASGTGQGGIWHLALAGMLNTGGNSPDAAPWVPSKGAAPGLQELVAGGVDIVTCSIVEAGALIDAGKVKALAIMDTDRNAAFPDVPTLQEAASLDWQMAAWRGLAGPKGMPDEATATLTTAFEKVWQSAEFQEFMNGRGFGLVWKPGNEFSEWMDSSDAALGSVMKAVGLAK